MIRVLVVLAALSAVFAGCQRGGDAPDDDGSGVPTAADGTGTPTAPGPEAPAADEAAPVDAATPPADDARYAAPPDDPTEPPPDLVTLMRAIGFADAVPADLADFVHVPPGAEGEAGSFGGSDGEVRVALVRYPNPRYARPHRTDVEERRRVVPDLGEAVAQQGRFVVHVRAAQRSRADAVVAAIVEELGWNEVSGPR